MSTAAFTYNITDYVTFGQECHEKKNTLSKADFNQFKAQFGKTLVNHCLKITQWWETLSDEWQEKFKQLPFANINQNGLNQLIKVPLEHLTRWWEQINSFNTERGYLCPEDIGKVASTLIPKKKTGLKLEDPVTEDDYLFVAKQYKFTPEQLQQLKDQCIDFAEEDPVFTEDLLTILEERWEKTDLKILVTRERHTWQLMQKDQEIINQKLLSSEEKLRHEKEKTELIKESRREFAELKQMFEEQLAQLKQMYETKFAQLERQLEKVNKKRNPLSEMQQTASKSSNKPKGFGTSAKSQS